MTIEQTVTIPADYRIFFELPRSVPTGVQARVEISIPAVETNSPGEIASPPAEIEGIRQLLQEEMAKKGTSAITVATGDGWESHIREHYAQP